MAKKRNKSGQHNFNHDPFKNLKGFIVSKREDQERSASSDESLPRETVGSFAEEMEKLGVCQFNQDVASDGELSEKFYSRDSVGGNHEETTDKELFLAALGELPVRFNDHLPEDDDLVVAVPRRMKQLKQGRLAPDASLDLHGCRRAEIAEKLRNFLQNSQYQGWQTLLVITGKGLHSEAGEPVVRNAAEQFLSSDEGRKLAAEWGRAPKQYGGDGALILFLRKND